MPCHGCATKFGFLNKEHGCPSCGFSFCNSCLKQKYEVPKLGNAVCKVCKSCYTKLSSGDTDENKEQNIAPPDMFLKRLETLDQPPRPPITVYRTEQRLQKLVQGLNSTDLEIARRLEKLREERHAAKSVPTVDEIAQRLAVLRGQDSEHAMIKPNKSYVPPDSRTCVQKTDDLFQEMTEEVALDAKYKRPEDDIAERLQRLRGSSDPQTEAGAENATAAQPMTLDEVTQLLAQCKLESGKDGKHPDLATVVSLEQIRARLSKEKDLMEQGSDEDDASAAQKIIEKAQAEVELERKLYGEDREEEMIEVDIPDDKEELPWCIICNEDAVVRCLSCDGDLFCKDCFKEGHTDPDMRDHSYEAFKKK